MLGELDERRALALLGIVTCMERGTMTPHDQRYLCEHFVLGWVDVEVRTLVDGDEVPTWRRVDSFDTLDDELDGSQDAEVWTDLLWRQIPHCLGPIIAVGGT